ncbi:right-handed parallel beta-helix repeat-containing protein [Flavobacterium sp.]|uniref:right-handed parallel beta-helix repeat-containing protein n=1 Tax=Flavobacterium sp. TaxID=239 RepID=UPI002B4B6D40|nr:right-handed parallel beta-helix repeat-containing protein [Flavobacterium sp.]HLF51188.1 right-handed parallel beta-helix repeat-containing protein [Flavobacterium sp.]
MNLNNYEPYFKYRSLFFNFYLILNLALSIVSCNAQAEKFTYKGTPKKYFVSSVHLGLYKKHVEKEKLKAYDLTRSLPKGYLKNGTKDYTKYLQDGMNNYRVVIFPNFPVLVNKEGLGIKSNSTVIFQKNSKLIMEPNAMDSYQVLRLFNIKNSVVYFPVIKGDRNYHLDTKGEWGMGISIMGSSNIKIINPKISDCWGDGIYIGKSLNSSKNINIYYPELDNNRRNGISIVSGDRIFVESPLVSNTHGTMPGCGIDIEPNNNNDEINNIFINNPITYNNERYGISIYMKFLRGKLKKDVNISINNHLDNGSISGFIIDEPSGSYKADRPLMGNVIITKPIWINNKKRIVFKNNEFSPKLVIKN